MRKSPIVGMVACFTLMTSGLALAYQPPYNPMDGFSAVPYPAIPGMDSQMPGVAPLNMGFGPRMPQIPQIPGMPDEDEMAPPSQDIDPATAMTLQMLPPPARQVYLDSLKAQAQAKQAENQVSDSNKVASITTPDMNVWKPSVLDVPVSLAKPEPNETLAYNTIVSSVNANPPGNPYTYTGREDDGTGLYYYRGRYYDPELEVFISKDPRKWAAIRTWKSTEIY